MAKKEDFEYVHLEDVPLMVNDFTVVSGDFKSAIGDAAGHLKILEDKHDTLAEARVDTAELRKLVAKLDGFFMKDLAKPKAEPFIPKDVFATKEDRQLEVKGQHALRNIQHNLEELKKHLNLL